MRKRFNGMSLQMSIAVILGMVLGGCGDSVPPAVLEPKSLSDTAMDVSYEAVKIPSRMKASETATAVVKIKNESQEAWPAKASADGRDLSVASHWFFPNGETALFEGRRSRLRGDLHPGKTLTVDVIVRAPDRPGRYRLQFDMVQEYVAWFSLKKSSVLSVPVVVE